MWQRIGINSYAMYRGRGGYDDPLPALATACLFHLYRKNYLAVTTVADLITNSQIVML